MTAKSITHKFVSGVSDGGDTTLVRPSNWNDDHNWFLGRRTITGATDTIANADALCQLLYNRSSAIAVTLNQPTGGNFPNGWMTYVRNIGAGTVTITPTSATINQGSSLAVLQYESAIIISDGTNFDASLIGRPIRDYTGQLPATATNDSASAGNLGQEIIASLPNGSASGLPNNTGVSIVTLALTAGDWDASGVLHIKGPSSTVVNYVGATISTVLSASPTGDDVFSTYQSLGGSAPFSVVSTISVRTGPGRISLSGSTNVYLNAQVGFATSTPSAYGTIRARRVR